MKSRRAVRNLSKYRSFAKKPQIPQNWQHISAPQSYQNKDRFTFLNISYEFKQGIDWNILKHGKLWQYNLRYFDYLRQPNVSTEEGLRLINDFIEKLDSGKIYPEPYPVSLRCCNWMHFLMRRNIQDEKIWQWTYAQLRFLEQTVEIHIQANHLLENLITLGWGALIFREENWVNKIEKELPEQLEEQFLSDGAHYELSPMYHSIMLHRLLELYELNLALGNTLTRSHQKLAALLPKAMNWLEQMIVDENYMPCFNDAAQGIAPEYGIIRKEYQRLFGTKTKKSTIGESGYRRLEHNGIVLIADVGHPAVSYQPGHVHNDMLSFECYVDKQPILVNSGTSTYENNERRHYERSALAHNTIVVGDKNHSDTWSAFRVGKRAQCKICEELPHFLKAQVVTKDGEILARTWKAIDSGWEIHDKINSRKSAKIYFHLHHELRNIVKINKNKGEVSFGKGVVLTTSGEFDLIDCKQAVGFNAYREALAVIISFRHENQTIIQRK